MAEALSPAAWRQPAADEVEFDGGRVTVSPSSAAPAVFVRLEIPKD